MYESHPAIRNFRYNAATECFEALAVFTSDAGRTRLAVDYPAPLDTEYDAAIAGLRAQALRSLDRPNALRARLERRPDAGHPAAWTGAGPIQKFFGQLFGNRAA